MVLCEALARLVAKASPRASNCAHLSELVSQQMYLPMHELLLKPLLLGITSHRSDVCWTSRILWHLGAAL